jgi:molybdopterin-synthase adenylyltransferase
MRRLSVAMTGKSHARLARQLLRPDGQEDVCFALYRPSTGSQRDSCLVGELVHPTQSDRQVHGNASFSSEYFLRAAAEADREGAGVALLHSHPAGRGWQDMSEDDLTAERRYAAQALSLAGLPLLGLTIAGDERWSARTWRRPGQPGPYDRHDSATVRVIAERLAITHHPRLCAPASNDARMVRTISAWSEPTQHDLARQHVGIIGAGSVGAIVGEALARTGVKRITIIDFDTVKLHNLDRLAHATRLDAILRRSKAQVLRNALLKYGTAPDLTIDAVELSVAAPEGYKAALDCDVLFSCVDRPWPRQILDHIAYAHLIPVVDGGIAVRARPRLTNADWKAHIAAPGRPCLECLGQYLPADVSLERSGDLDDPSYINSLPVNHPLRASENVYAFSLACASLEILQWLSMTVAPLDIADVGSWNFHFVTGTLDQLSTSCRDDCLHHQQTAKGDLAPLQAPIGRHDAAEQERATRTDAQRRTLVRAALCASRWQDRAARMVNAAAIRLDRRENSGVPPRPQP